MGFPTLHAACAAKDPLEASDSAAIQVSREVQDTAAISQGTPPWPAAPRGKTALATPTARTEVTIGFATRARRGVSLRLLIGIRSRPRNDSTRRKSTPHHRTSARLRPRRLSPRRLRPRRLPPRITMRSRPRLRPRITTGTKLTPP